MRYLLSLLTFFAVPFCLSAQSGWQLSSSVGANFTNVHVNGLPSVFYPDAVYADPDILIDVRVSKKIRKHWQVGLLVETGNMRTNLWHKLDYYSNDKHVNSTSHYQKVKLISPFVLPAAFIHYRLDYGKNSHLYAGPVIGVITGSNEIDLGKNLTCPVGGADLGLALGLNQHAKLQLGMGWRLAYVNLDKNDGHKEYPLGTGDYVIRRFSLSVAHYFTGTIGIVALL
ncbi:MAG TPA: hypothetical protein VIN07_14775 [Flavipsychrobacter sp.]